MRDRSVGGPGLSPDPLVIGTSTADPASPPILALKTAAPTLMVGLSGGVDSSVAAALLLEQGERVEALFMKNWEEDDTDDYCAAAADLADAQGVAERLGLRLHAVNFATEYWDRVFAHFLSEYSAGRTPNPDVLCNREIKFRAFLDHALGLGATGIATGHYARVDRDASGWHLRLSADSEKDQTYFLYLLDQEQLAHSRFPLGHLRKAQVRDLAAQFGLATAAKRDSTGICFIGERRFRDFLCRYLPRDPGPIETPDGTTLGEHQGLAYYTIGQRHGLGVGGLRGAGEAPWFVARKDQGRNTLILVQGGDHPLLLSTAAVIDQVHWIAGRPPPLPLECLARARHRQPLQACMVLGYDQDRAQVRFRSPQRALAPGQSLVLYSGDECLGGGVIETAEALDRSLDRR
jgi:tRNA-specific 2-thiouridylase